MALHNQRLDCFDLLRASVCLRTCVCCRCSTMWLIIAGTVGERETNSSPGAEGGKTEKVIGMQRKRKGRKDGAFRK